VARYGIGSSGERGASKVTTSEMTRSLPLPIPYRVLNMRKLPQGQYPSGSERGFISGPRRKPRSLPLGVLSLRRGPLF